jgi:DNA-binding CsgD family transcriptional regulator/predicted negative regulator of RcsB-dependent stress response/predicted nuclease with TOPRIM domain
MQLYLSAQKNAESSDDNNIKGLICFYIGRLNYNQTKYDNAIYNFKLALEHFNRFQDYKRAIPAFTMIANTFLIQNNTDSTFIYYDKALQLAESHQDSVQQAIIRQNLGTVYWAINKPDTAIKQLYQALELNPKLSDKIYLNLGSAYGLKGMTDSAKYFAGLSLDLLKEKNDVFSLSGNYELLSRLEEQNGNYSEALNCLHEYNKYIKQINTRKEQFNIDEIEKNYNLKLLNESRDRIQSYKITVTVMAILIFASVIFSCIRNRKLRQSLFESENKSNSLLAENVKLQQSLSESENKINSLLAENEKLQQSLSESENKVNSLLAENEKLQQLLFEFENKFNSLLAENEKLTKRIIEFYKKACSSVYRIETGPKDNIEVKSKETTIAVSRVAGIIFQKGRWDSINYLFDTLFENIREQTLKYELKDIYLKIICLIYIGFNNTEISAVVNISPNTVQQTKAEIRKKLGMDSGAKIKDFVSNLIKNMQ